MTAPRVEVTSADIARLAGVGPNAVSNWRKRHEDFPEPIGGTDRSPLFSLAEVQDWLRTQGKIVQVSADQSLWQAFESARTAINPAGAFGMVGTLLLYLRRHPKTPIVTDPKGFERLMARAEHSWLTEAKLTPGLIDTISTHGMGARLTTLLHAAMRTAATNGPDETFDSLCQRVLDSSARTSIGPTPVELAGLMIDLAGPVGGTLLDPACGTGSILLAAADRGYPRVEGQEVHPSTARIALLRLAFRTTAEEKPVGYNVHVGDSFLSDGFQGREFAAVVCNPPFADRTWWHDSLLHDRRWVYGIPARLDSELAWVQHALSHVVPGGSVVMLMPPGAGTRPSGRRIRAALIQRGALRAVIALPPRLAARYALSLQIWVLARPKPHAATPSHILLLDTAGAEPNQRVGTPPRRAGPAWEQVRGEITECWSSFIADPTRFPERPELARAVPVAEFLDADVDVTPRRYLPMTQESAVTRATLENRHATLARLIKDLNRLLPNVAPPSLPESGPIRLVSIDELAKAGSIFLRRPSIAPAMQDPEPESDGVEEVRALTARDLVLGQAPTERMTVAVDPVRNPPIREGDVLIPAHGRRLTARVATEDDLGAYASASVFILRPDPGILDPWFLAGFLSSSDGGRQAVRATGTIGDVARFDPRKVRIPLPPIEAQRTYGALFQRLSQFSLALRAAHDQGRELVTHTTDALLADISSTATPRTPPITAQP